MLDVQPVFGKILAKEHRKQLPQPIRLLIEQAFAFLRDSKDKAHAVDHALKMIRDCARIAKEHKLDIRPELVGLAVLWHDVWKAQLEPTKNIFKILFREVMEGSKAANLFIQHATQLNLDEALKTEVANAIRRHASFTIQSPQTLLDRILIDADVLQMFDPKRFTETMDGLLPFQNPFFLMIVITAIERQMRSYAKKNNIHFGWTKEKRTQLKKELDLGFEKKKREVESKIAEALFGRVDLGQI